MVNCMDDLERLATLLARRNELETEIVRIIDRPATRGHIGEFIASRIFDIALEQSASNRTYDGRFRSGPLEGKSVDVKFYGKQEGILAVEKENQPDYFLVMTGPESPAGSSKSHTRPTVITAAYLFAGDKVAKSIMARGVQFGVAASIPKALWGQAQVFPSQNNPVLPLSGEQRGQLALFS